MKDCQEPTILIDPDEHRVVAETIGALKADSNIYYRGIKLVRVIRDQTNDGIMRCKGSATIQEIPPPNLRERMTRVAHFTKRGKKGKEIPAHPPNWLVNEVLARANWPGIRQLTAVANAPVLRADGSIWQTPGYDALTGVIFEPNENLAFAPIPDDVCLDQAIAAAGTLMAVVCDFPFESEEHKAAWLAALLTAFARFAFEGPSPLFLIDANIRGVGKGLLAQTIGRIVQGRELPVSSYAHDSEEMRKKLTAIALAGDPMILLDNLEGKFGNDALDRALTSTRWKDRILGKNEEIELPLMPVWLATGNNVQVSADTLRRVIQIRLDCLNECPEARSDFKHDNLIAWIADNRGTLVAAALTILSAFLKREVASTKLESFGSFEGWSRIVREAVVWVGLPDPCLTRVELAKHADALGDLHKQLLDAWETYDPRNDGVVVAETLERLYSTHHDGIATDEASNDMRMALASLVGCASGGRPTPRQVGNKLRKIRRRVVNGRFIDVDQDAYNRHGAVWKLYHVKSRVCETIESDPPYLAREPQCTH